MQEHVMLSERPEDLRKAVIWAREEQQRLRNEKSEKLARELMKEMSPIILKSKEK